MKILACFKKWPQSVVTSPRGKLPLRCCGTCWRAQFCRSPEVGVAVSSVMVLGSKSDWKVPGTSHINFNS